MLEETSSTPVSDPRLVSAAGHPSSAAALTMDSGNVACGARQTEPRETPLFVVVRPPIPGKTAWSMAPW